MMYFIGFVQMTATRSFTHGIISIIIVYVRKTKGKPGDVLVNLANSMLSEKQPKGYT